MFLTIFLIPIKLTKNAPLIVILFIYCAGINQNVKFYNNFFDEKLHVFPPSKTQILNLSLPLTLFRNQLRSLEMVLSFGHGWKCYY